MKGLTLQDVLEGATFDRKLHQEIPMNQVWDKKTKAVSKDKIKEIADRFNKPLRKIKHIGSGAIGSAFLLSPRRVIKMTTSRREFKKATALVGARYNNVYKVYKTFIAGGKFFIITDRYYRPTAIQMGLLKLLTYNTFAIGFKSCGWKRVRNQFINAHKTSVEYGDCVAGSCEKAVKMLVKFGVKRMIQELRHAQIKASDFHEGNVMRKKNGQLVIIDIFF